MGAALLEHSGQEYPCRWIATREKADYLNIVVERAIATIDALRNGAHEALDPRLQASPNAVNETKTHALAGSHASNSVHLAVIEPG